MITSSFVRAGAVAFLGAMVGVEASPLSSSSSNSNDTMVAATPSVFYTTEVVTALTTFCPEATTLSFNNVTYTITKPTTLTVTNCPCTVTKPATSTQLHIQDCARDCSAAYNKCRGESYANMASCAAEYAECLGYSPYGTDGSLITPTACSTASIQTPFVNATTSVPIKPTTTKIITTSVSIKPKTTSKPKTSVHIAEKPTTTSVPVEPTTSVPAAPVQPTTTTAQPVEPESTSPAKACAVECTTMYQACVGTPNQDPITCAAEFNGCLGYSPFDEAGNYETPTACSFGATGMSSAAGPTSTTPAVVPTGAAARIAPQHLLLALGAFALL